MKVKFLLFVLVISLFLLTGALGLVMPEECDDISKYPFASDKIPCYHRAAISIAYLGDFNEAVGICEDIWTGIGRHFDEGDDTRKKAELVTNSCYYDIARIAREPAICERIGELDDPSRSARMRLYGQATTRQMCVDEVSRLACARPDEYFRASSGGSISPYGDYCDANDGNLCAIIFVLPLLLFAVLNQRTV